MNDFKPITVPLAVVAFAIDRVPSRVVQLVRQGILPTPIERGKYDLIACVRAFILHQQDRGRSRSSQEAERTRLLKAQADKMEMEVLTLGRQLIPADHVVLAWQKLIAAARARLLAMPSQLAPQLAGINEIQAIKDHITESVREALEELSRFELGKVSRRSRANSRNVVAATAETNDSGVGKHKPTTEQRG